MTPEEAIQLLHNRQYMQYKGNGKAVFIHQLTDEEVKMVESLISSQASLIARQHRMIEKTVKKLIKDYDYCFQNDDDYEFIGDCEIVDGDYDCKDCLTRWLEQAEEVGE